MNPIETAPHFTPVTVRGEEDQKTTAVYLNDDTPGWYVPGKIYERLEWEPVEWCPAPSGEALDPVNLDEEEVVEIDREHVKKIMGMRVVDLGTINFQDGLTDESQSDACPDCLGTGRWIDENETSVLGADMGPCPTCTGTASRAEVE